MRLCALSPFESATEDDILSFLKKTTASLVLLPGSASNTPSPEKVQQVIPCRDVSVFVEYGARKTTATPYLVTKQTIVSMPSQIFSQRPTAQQMDELAECLADRTFKFGSRKVTFLICGEIIAFNPDGTTKHRRKLSYDILANPAHTIMGHWNHLGRKLTTLSRNTYVLYATNNDRNSNRTNTDVRIYNHEKLLPKGIPDHKINWCDCEV